jgi:transposase
VVEEVDPRTGVRLRFRNADATALQIAGRPLDVYLRDAGLGWVVDLRAHLDALDVTPLWASYQPIGRPAFHPRRLLGLIVYGLLVRQWSLRELEALARKDLGAILVCGGLQPDHSALAEFFTRHTAAFTEDFFVAVTRQLVTALHLEPVLAAGDGTVVEAAASRFRALRGQALAAAHAAAVVVATDAPTDAAAQARLAQTTHAAAVAADRTAARHAKDPKAPPAAVVPHEPDAVVQPRKDGARRPGYKPALNVHPTRLILGQHVEPSSETAAVLPLLIQHRAVFDARPRTQLLDAGYHAVEVLALCVVLDLDVLCPSGKGTAPDLAKSAADDTHPKTAFRYDAATDTYHCPVGAVLRRRDRERDRHGVATVRYAAPAATCAACAQRARCTRATGGRTVRRYDGDDLKAAMADVLAQPAARRQYRRRQATVEPVFAALRDRQGLVRFHRRGLPAVRAEFALHCIAYNLRQAGRLRARAAVAAVAYRRADGAWCVVVVVALWARRE